MVDVLIHTLQNGTRFTLFLPKTMNFSENNSQVGFFVGLRSQPTKNAHESSHLTETQVVPHRQENRLHFLSTDSLIFLKNRHLL